MTSETFLSREAEIKTVSAVPVQPKASSRWPIAAVLIMMLLIVGGPFAYMLVSWSNRLANAPQELAQSFANAAAQVARPKIEINTVINNTIADVQKQNKLVVFETTVNADVTREEGASSWGVYWGTNVARVAVRDARVQYVIDLNRLGTSDFQYDRESKLLTVCLPRPRVDTSMVNIDPARIQTLDLRGGWARFDKQETRDSAIATLRPQVINQAQAPFVRELAANAGIDSMAHLLEPLASALAQDGAKLKISYMQ